jgi:hypothetical protein
MNALNSLIHALQKHGGVATTTQLKAVRPKLKDIVKTSLDLVDYGLAIWDEGPDGTQELRLTEATLAQMSPNARKMTHAELRSALDQGEDLTGYTVLVVKS